MRVGMSALNPFDALAGPAAPALSLQTPSSAFGRPASQAHSSLASFFAKPPQPPWVPLKEGLVCVSESRTVSLA